MSLYDDVDPERDGRGQPAATAAAGWSAGIRLLQSQMQLRMKRAANTAASVGAGAGTPQQHHGGLHRERRHAQVLLPVIDLKSKRDDDDSGIFPAHGQLLQATRVSSLVPTIKDYDWNVVGEYDPMWPNDYEKVVRELRDQRDRENDLKYDEKERKSHRKRKSRFGDGEDIPEKTMHRHAEEDAERSPPARTGGAAIAPPPSLQESEPSSPPAPSLPVFEKPEKPIVVGGYGANSVAAKIMAKYGFKEGQGLGKKEQGMSMALQVEKTSKRGGRIIHEKDGSVMPPPPPLLIPPQSGSPIIGSDLTSLEPAKSEPTITEIMKSPSKVVLLRNMVGPGDVDEELEPEVKDECNTKYGDVIKVIIFEIPSAPSDEAVRIFVEFKRIESAIKAVVDLNGRFFGGRQVKAGFYSTDQFTNLKLLD
ncbi:splicing factor 45 isoform X1 [Arctopsyche grandis]|uniref:splicing factor 45 isoform X1 n=1 Tax=Arctopsyche grandis TaxID=121162 RepID=UPI00406D8F45